MVNNISYKNARTTPEGRLIAAMQLLTAHLARFVFWLWGGATIRSHITTVTPQARYVIAANHQSRLDAFAIFAFLPRRQRKALVPIRFMTFPRMYHHPLLKWFLYSHGAFPAHIKERPYHTYGVEGSISLLRRGYNICIFPEGTRSLPAQSQPKAGISRILQAEPGAQLLLAHINWKIYSPWRRHVRITLMPAPPEIDRGDPKAIMNAIYKV